MRLAPIDAGFELSDAMRDWAEKTVPQVKLDIEFEKFKDYWLGNGKAMANWEATLRNWLRRCVDFKGTALYTADEMRLKRLSAEYVSAGFRPPRPSEPSTVYDFEYQHWKRVRDGTPKRDMGIVTAITRAKTG